MNPIKIGIAGLGNVGEEVAYQLIKGFRVQNDQFKIELHGVSAKSKDKKRKIDYYLQLSQQALSHILRLKLY